MQFKNNAEVVAAVTQIKKEANTKRPHYPILFKKAVIEYASSKKMSLDAIADLLGTANSTPYKWKQQYTDGLFSMVGAYSVSNKSKTINTNILASLKQELDEIQEKIALVERATALGLTIS